MRLFYCITLHESLVSFVAKFVLVVYVCVKRAHNPGCWKISIDDSRLNALLYDLAFPPELCNTYVNCVRGAWLLWWFRLSINHTTLTMKWFFIAQLSAHVERESLTYDWWDGNLRVRTVGRAKLSWKRTMLLLQIGGKQQYLGLNEEKAETWSHTEVCLSWCEIFHCVIHSI